MVERQARDLEVRGSLNFSLEFKLHLAQCVINCDGTHLITDSFRETVKVSRIEVATLCL